MLFAVAMVVGLILRIATTFTSTYRLDSDQAVVYLMARHVAIGELPSFYWGQSYGGSILPLSAGVVMTLLGESPRIFALVTALWWAAAAILLWRFTITVVGPAAGTLAAVLFWFPGYSMLLRSIGDPGFYGPSLVIGLAALVLAVRWSEPRRLSWWIGLGAIAGLALWTSAAAAAMALPAIAWVVLVERRARMWAAGAVAALVTSLPWSIETITSGFGSVRPFGGPNIHIDSVVTAFASMIPAAFPFGMTTVGRVCIGGVAFGLLAGVVVSGIRRRGGGVLLIGIGALLTLGVLIVGSGTTLDADSSRYTAFFLPTLAFGAALFTRKLVLVQYPAGFAGVAVTFAMFLYSGGFPLNPEHDPYDHDFAPVEAELKSLGVRHAYGSYWLAYTLTASSGETVTVADLGVRRYAPYAEAAAHRVPEVIVVYLNGGNDQTLMKTRALPRHSRVETGGYAVWILYRWIDLTRLPLGTE